jgi:hypothetical protein
MKGTEIAAPMGVPSLPLSNALLVPWRKCSVFWLNPIATKWSQKTVDRGVVDGFR